MPKNTEGEAYGATRVSKGASQGRGLRVLEDAILGRYGREHEDSDNE